jgi:ketosteroid isomerase-like protein
VSPEPLSSPEPMSSSGPLPKARTPEDLTRLVVDRANAGDAAGIAALYEQAAVMGHPEGSALGRPAIQAAWASILESGSVLEHEPPGPTLITGNIGLATTVTRDGRTRVQVVRRQPDGTWLRLIDQPDPGRR